VVKIYKFKEKEMNNFIYAASPWVIIGMAVVALVASRAKRKDNDEKKDNYMTEGMCIGICLGVALSSSGIDQSLGISLGMLIGEIIGMNIKK